MTAMRLKTALWMQSIELQPCPISIHWPTIIE
jgi:hypothetical protein